MDLALALSHLSCFLLTALAVAVPNLRLRQVAVANLIVSTALTLWHGMQGSGERTLTTVHHYAAFNDKAVEISMAPFPTHTHVAAAGLWPLPFVGFAIVWIAVLLGLRQRTVRNPWILPLLLAWSAMATWLAMQFYAAPERLVQPFGLDRFLWPAGLALALVAARRADRVLHLTLMVGGGVMLSRLPAAIFSKIASDAELGTCLDIHTIRNIVNPMTRMQFDPRLVIGSGEQQFWLIWLEHIIFYPAIYLMSLFGVAFGAYMWRKHAPKKPPTTT